MRYNTIDYKINKDEISMAVNSAGYNKTKFYWLCQLGGWGFFTLVNIVFIASTEKLSFEKALFLILISSISLLITHLYRLYIIKHNWFKLPLKYVVPVILLASLILGSIIVAFYLPVNSYFKIFIDPDFKLSFVTVVAIILNFSVLFLVWNLIYFFIYFFENYKRAEIESLIWEAAVKDFELKTLKTQLNPHFMFNAMNSIRALIEEDPSKAQNALTKLSNILRYSLKIERNETVPLIEEVKVVKDYLDLECIRYEERINYKIDIQPEAENIEIPPMMIQTLVENGIKHGISKLPTGGEIIISAKNCNNKLVINILNSGVIDTHNAFHSNGYGINNTKQRLYLMYSDKASFNIFNTNGFVNAEVNIPIGGIIK